MIKDTISFATGLHPLNPLQIQKCMNMGLKIPEHFPNKVSDVAVKDQW